jgi:UDP-2,3-diacylglucosamine hydrolase
VEVHYFTGNHDIWMYGYLEEECGVIMHHQALTTDIMGKTFFMAHGDGLGDPERKFKFIRRMFHNKVCQRLFSTLHPRWSMWFGLTWAKHSRMKRADGKEEPYKGEDREFLIQYTKEYMKTHPDIDYYIYGHRHIELDMMLSRKSRMMIIGDWIWQFTYVVFDGEHIFLEQYVEGESQL